MNNKLPNLPFEIIDKIIMMRPQNQIYLIINKFINNYNKTDYITFKNYINNYNNTVNKFKLFNDHPDFDRYVFCEMIINSRN